MYMESFIRYNVYLSAQQLQALQRIYDEEGVKIAEQIRRALDAFLMKKGQLQEKTRVPFRIELPSRPTRRKRSK